MNSYDFSEKSTAELRALIAAAQQELSQRDAAAAPVANAAKVRVTKHFASYNEKRYGLPWIARVAAWPVGGKPTLSFGAYVGENGGAGEAELMASPGDIVRWGQKDNRGSNSTSDWGVVESDGAIRAVSQSEARSLFGAPLRS